MNKTIQSLILSGLAMGSAGAATPQNSLEVINPTMTGYHQLLRGTTKQLAELADKYEIHNQAVGSIPNLDVLRSGLDALDSIDEALPDIDYNGAINRLFEEADDSTELERLIDGREEREEKESVQFEFETTDLSDLHYDIAVLESMIGDSYINCATNQVNLDGYAHVKQEVKDYKAELVENELYNVNGETRLLETVFINTKRKLDEALGSNPVDCSHYNPEAGAVQKDRVLPSEDHSFDYTGTLLSEENTDAAMTSAINRLEARAQLRREAEAQEDLGDKPSVCQYVNQGFVPRKEFNHRKTCQGNIFDIQEDIFRHPEFEVFYDANAGAEVNNLLHCDSYVKLKVDSTGWIEENSVSYPGGKDLCSEVQQ